MIQQAYSIYDKKLGAYVRPFFCPNDNVALRSISMAILKDPGFHQFPEDYSLNKIGTFDDTLGVIKGEPIKILSELQTIHNEATLRQNQSIDDNSNQ